VNARQRRKYRRALPAVVDPIDPDADLPDGLWRDATGTLTYTCRHCDSTREWYGEPEEFDMFNHFECGGSPYCMP
jgi:hypothetical protein